MNARRVAAGLVVAVVACGGCGFSPGSGGDDAPADAPIGDGGADANSGLPAGRCGGVGVFLDDFADGTPAYFWAVTSLMDGDVREDGGALTMSPRLGRVGYVTYPSFDLTDAAIEIEVPSMVDGATAAVAGVVLADPQGLRVGFAQQSNLLYAIIDGVGTVTVAFDPVAHRWWRIAHTNNSFVLATSPDRAAWIEIHRGTWSASYLQMVLFAEWAGGSDAGTVTFQSMRAYEGDVQVGPAAWCKPSTLDDEFSGSAFDPRWFGFPQNGGCSLYVFSDHAYFDHNGATSCYTALISRRLYDLTDSALIGTIEPIAISPAGWSGSMALADPTDQRLSIYATGGTLCPDHGDTAPPCIAYGGQRYWRIAEAAGVVTWDASVDGVAWTPLLSEATAIDVTRLRIGLGASGIPGPPFQFAIDAIGPL